ncbi:MAG: histidinol-phosphate transaminase [Candidatus Omnitrophota bacterium]|nr:histidinol-phosphate transaminase [Candidatus Omnitrophota bacterium]MBU1928970.1 histidinol-phosphate transaminase [Candidatus Omnitrophota bacterium]MBU2035727.1 histidinol-phosphate transaminase [Candidatus Omnitrophota bacterium]MBU2221285.1 histidinol-phosphate transaminase [Candidatus Omnitrophota bacterium]
MELIRKDILKLKAYIAGKPIEETKREFGLKEVIKLASNENPLGSSPKAIKALLRSLTGINRYPDAQGFYLKKKIARVSGLAPENIVLGNGSDELIDVIIKTFVENNENIVSAGVTFLEYEIIAGINGRRILTVPLRDFKFDLPRIRKNINNKTKLVFIANPNNPTGTYVNAKELKKFISSLPGSVILVLDEAYDAFIDVKDFPRGIEYLDKNVLVLKTFSKAYGLAGLRIGYCLANEKFASYMERVRQPFNVNSLAQAAANMALEDNDFLSKTRRANLNGKAFLYDSLDKIGVFYVPSVTNFILIDTGIDCLEVFKELLKLGVIVRDMAQYKLNSYIRVTIGTKKENEAFIKAFKKVLIKLGV